MDIHANRLLCGGLFIMCFSLPLATEVRADELARENGNVRDSSTQATDEQPFQQRALSAKRWHINLDAGSREAHATGMPMMIVFR